MNLQIQFLIYAALFRVAIIAAGVACIALGYKLFVLGIEGTGKRETSIDAQIAGGKFTLKNAAPGTGFALFGAIIICVMLVQGNPELTVKTLDKVPKAAGTEDAGGAGSAGAGTVTASTANTAGSSETTLTLRGDGGAPGRFEAAVNKGLEFDRKRDLTNAVGAYEDAMTVMATPMNQLAWDYLQQGKTESALPLSRLAVQLSPGNASFAETLAEILAKDGKTDEALTWMRKAAALNPKYQEKLQEMQRAGQR